MLGRGFVVVVDGGEMSLRLFAVLEKIEVLSIWCDSHLVGFYMGVV